jgi:dUTP pyrophosphatase
VARAEFIEVDSLEDTSRGDTGHGSSGGFGTHNQTTKD